MMPFSNQSEGAGMNVVGVAPSERGLSADVGRKVSARGALMTGVLANATACCAIVCESWFLAIAGHKGPALIFLVLAAAMGWSSHWLKSRQSIIAAWTGFALNAALSLYNVVGVFETQGQITAIAEALVYAVLAGCSSQGVWGAHTLRLHELATVPVTDEPNPCGEELDFTYLFMSFDGRINRMTFWLGFSFLVILYSFGNSFNLYFGFSGERSLLSSGFGLVSLYPATAVVVKRLHDLNWGGYLAGLLVIPLFLLWLDDVVEFGRNPSSVTLMDLNALDLLLGAIFIVIFIPLPFFVLVLGFRRGAIGPNAYGAEGRF
jgi:uncharacterized membrane protein YhaH (DUF805 family)